MILGSRPRDVALAVLVVVAIGVVGSAIVAADEYEITASDPIDTPEETHVIEGQTYTVDSVGQVRPGQSISVEVSAPSDATYIVELYNSDEQIEDETRGSGSGTYYFSDTDEYGIGSYVATVYADGEHQDVQPMIISGYNVYLTYPQQFELDGDDLEITLTLSPAAADDPPPNDGEVALWRDGQTLRAPADHVEGDEYIATFSADELEAGDYKLYGGAQGELTSEAEYEVLGASAQHELEVVEPESDDGGSSLPGGGDDGDETDDEESSDDEGGTDDAATDDDTDGTAENETDDSSDETDEIQMPQEDKDTDDGGDDDDGLPVLAPTVIIATLIATTFAVRIQRRR